MDERGATFAQASSVSSGPAAPQHTSEAGGGRPPRRRRLRAFAVLALVLAGAVLMVVVTDPFAGGGSAPTGVVDNGAPTATATVTRGSLTSQTELTGTLGYAGNFSIVNQATGAATWLPGGGQVIGRGQVLYRASGQPVLLLYGSTPAYRLLKEGMTGVDVQQLNSNLVALGYASSDVLDPSSDYFGWATRGALERLQEAFGVKQTGKLSLGQAVFLPGAVRITSVTATLGTTLSAGGVIAQASSTRRHVSVQLDAAQQGSVHVGDRVTVTLPDGGATAGVVAAVGKVASSSSGSTTIPVYIALKHPRAVGRLDQAPVSVTITTARVRHALIVPVDALLALAGGGYAVETLGARGVHHLVAVTPGLFDDADGLVQVSGSLSAGEKIVVPST
jgi:peptidoglycan hydrolase-like protein with peptidoglycan-binding domain